MQGWGHPSLGGRVSSQRQCTRGDACEQVFPDPFQRKDSLFLKAISEKNEALFAVAVSWRKMQKARSPGKGQPHIKRAEQTPS